ncbi:MAG: 2OG-Fe(II) oxygenase [Akkermansiaceae bacterium]|nr:2OG-Fe(II) oxygenase [Akkermansiaceae bacterium]
MEDLIADLKQNGWACMTAETPDLDAIQLMRECASICAAGDFTQAATGRGSGLQVRDGIRGDQILWLPPGGATADQKTWLARLECFRLAINQQLFLGLFEYEGHFAVYPVGSFYKAHLDQHAGARDRILTVILYLNADWQPGDGGELKLWTTPQGREGNYQLIEPRMGTIVCFMSDEFWHEVLPTNKERMSITGWFRKAPAA